MHIENSMCIHLSSSSISDGLFSELYAHLDASSICTATHCNTLQHTATHCKTSLFKPDGRCTCICVSMHVSMRVSMHVSMRVCTCVCMRVCMCVCVRVCVRARACVGGPSHGEGLRVRALRRGGIRGRAHDSPRGAACVSHVTYE